MRNSTQIAARIALVTEHIGHYQAQRAALAERMQLQVGSTYTIKTGRKCSDESLNTYAEVPAVLVAQTERGGRMLYKFRIGEGFDEELVTADATRIVWEEELPSDLKLHNLIVKAEAELEELQAELKAAQKRENLKAGAEVQIQLGRDTTRRVVAATVVGKHTNADGVTRFAVITEDALQIIPVAAVVFAE